MVILMLSLKILAHLNVTQVSFFLGCNWKVLKQKPRKQAETQYYRVNVVEFILDELMLMSFVCIEACIVIIYFLINYL